MANILNYKIEDQLSNALLYDSNRTIVYRAVDQDNNKPVILKHLNQEFPTSQELARFRREFAVTRKLKGSGIVKVLDLEKYKNSLMLVLEDFGGDSLAVLKETVNLDIQQFLELAIGITEAVGQIHKQHIIHKDINPANIVWNRATGQVKIIDFGISTELSSISSSGVRDLPHFGQKVASS